MENRKAASAIESICFQIARLDETQQVQFIDSLRDILDDHELQALQIGIAYFRLVIHEDLRNAMKAALASELYKEFRKQIDN